MARSLRLAARLGVLLACLLAAASPAAAQLAQVAGAGAGKAQGDRNAPVSFTADNVTYDRENALVTASGHVEAWQNDQVLYADKVTFDRNTGILAASGNVVLLQPDGQVMFADYAELTQDMKDGVLRGMSAILTQNARLVANGARRTGGLINELSKVVYSTCNLCASDPTRPPLWQIRALNGVQDLEHKKIEYTDAVLQFYGVPVGYFPYFWTADPSVKRLSGLLIPSLGNSSRIGVFYAQPYYWVLDDQSDATITPMITSRAGPQLDMEYRRRFNGGTLDLNVSAGQLDGSAQGTIFAKGRFNYNDTWRWGFDLNRASSINYVNDFHLASIYGGTATVLTSQLYAEGFGEGAYSRLDTRFYQGVTSNVVASQLPVVLPRYEYSYFGRTDPLGGRLSFDTGAFNVYRADGTNTRRATMNVNWDRPFMGMVGDEWKFTAHLYSAAYDANFFNQQPNFGTVPDINDARALPQVALQVKWPWMRNSGSWGTQLIEPIIQVVAAPIVGNSQFNLYPNEDSLDLEFTDTNLFSLNRFPGIDRLEGGSRLSAALHGAWYLEGTTFDGLVGQSYQPAKDNNFSPQSGLRDQVSDVVARASLSPTPWLDLTYRTRLDKTNLATRFADATASVGPSEFRVNGGYIYTTDNPYSFYSQPPPPPASTGFYIPRNEIALGADSRIGPYHFAANMRRDLSTNKMVSVAAQGSWENECVIFSILYYRQYTQVGTYSGSSAVLFQITLKTIGQFGFHAL
ncbi:MAG: LPS-assembly protein LptD [Proteobacteria bacterium]|nr:LPS-assembly protein LptD [Pseudomonadota bacterium]